jgi:transcriptional regulator with XRE-family HTH domain
MTMAVSRTEEIGARIRERRKALDISQEELARLIGTNQKQVSRYENGENDPTANVIVELTYALDASADWLLGLSPHINRSLVDSTELSDIEREALQIIHTYQPDQQRKLVDFMYLSRRFIFGADGQFPDQSDLPSDIDKGKR